MKPVIVLYQLDEITMRRQLPALEESYEVIVCKRGQDCQEVFSRSDIRAVIVDDDPVDPGSDIRFVRAARQHFVGAIITTTDSRPRVRELMRVGCSANSSRVHLLDFLLQRITRLTPRH